MKERERERQRKRWFFQSRLCVLCVRIIVLHKKVLFSRKTKMKRKAMLVVLFITFLQISIDCSAEGNNNGFSNKQQLFQQ
jgi:hypothetical protein